MKTKSREEIVDTENKSKQTDRQMDNQKSTKTNDFEIL